MTIQYEKHVVVNSDFTDQLEAWGTLKTHLEITVHKQDHTHEKIRGHVGEVFAQNHVDHLRMADGREFRLDQITSVVELKNAK
jgi:hypothetical protein